MSFERRFELPTFDDDIEPCVPNCKFADGECFEAGECLLQKNFDS